MIYYSDTKIAVLIFLLQSLTFKFKDKPEDSPSSKNLLLWMVRLIHADPMLMLNVSSINNLL